LGERNLKWLVLHGCQAVITAHEDGTYNDTALRALPNTHGRWHIVMGHYKEYNVSQVKDLHGFANALLMSVPIQTAYFDTDPDHNSSAIAAESAPTAGAFHWGSSTMVNDRWGTPWPDAPNATYYSQRWIRNWQQQYAATVVPTDILIMDTLAIESAEARALLGTDYLPFRRIHTDYMPTNPLPVLELESVDDALCQQRMKQSVDLQFFPTASSQQIFLTGDLLAARNDETTNNQAVGWVHRSSGGYHFVRVQNSMSLPTSLTNYQQAIQVALAYVGTHRLIEPVPGEQVDLLYVSAVRNALSRIDLPTSLVEEFTSDYYVAFGRRFQGVPVIGSELVLRLDGNGQLVMVRKNWRRITQVGTEIMMPSTNSLATLITQNPRFYPDYSTNPVDPSQIRIVDARCGYVEAPANYRQKLLRIGGSINFALGTNYAENLPQMTVSLEDNGTVQNLLGREYQPCLLSVQALRSDGCALLVSSPGGYNYAIEGSTNLADWVRLGTVTNVAGSATFVDSQANSLTRRFYRAVELP
jgi:hypothetical protein